MIAKKNARLDRRVNERCRDFSPIKPDVDNFTYGLPVPEDSPDSTYQASLSVVWDLAMAG